MRYPVTPDGHYFVVRGRLWRCTNPHLDATARKRYLHDLMQARRAVKDSKHVDNAEKLQEARAQVDRAKTALGERGPPWWGDDAPVFDKCLAKNTPYAKWFASLSSTV